jgi:hypothetical protein
MDPDHSTEQPQKGKTDRRYQNKCFFEMGTWLKKL